MSRRAGWYAAVWLAAAIPVLAQGNKTAGPKMVTNDITVTTDDGTYTGTMTLGVAGGKASGKLHITAPSEVLGDVAGTSGAGILSLDFPYRIPERNCGGTVRMKLTIPPKPGPVTGTMEAVGCGRDEASKLQGTVTLMPQALKQKK